MKKLVFAVLMVPVVLFCAATRADEVVASAAGGWFAADTRSVKDTTWSGGQIVGGETQIELQSSANAWGTSSGSSATISWQSTSGHSGTVAANTTANSVLWTPEASAGVNTLTYTSGSVTKTAAFSVAAATGNTLSDATGTPIGITGDVLVIDVSAGSSASTYQTDEYKNIDIGKFNCDVYKTTKIVLRKVPAGSYYCKPGAGESTAVSQKLTTRGYYIGVFPITQRQYLQVMGANPSSFKTDASGNPAAQRPVERISWNTVRGSVAAGTAITASSTDSFMKRLVARTGLSGFDLPTEAQWEIACRAGSTAAYGSYWNGTAAVAMTSSTIGKAAWYSVNSSSTTHAVGGKCPNLWGLYDMQGNVYEWCRDISTFPSFDGACVDVPYIGTSYDSGNYRIRRGGSWNCSAEKCLSSGRFDYEAYYYNDDIGFRLSESIEADTIRVSFNANGGSGKTGVQTYKRGKVFKLPKCTLIPPEGKKFAGWRGSNGKRYDDEMLVFNLAEPSESLIFTAIWQ